MIAENPAKYHPSSLCTFTFRTLTSEDCRMKSPIHVKKTKPCTQIRPGGFTLGWKQTIADSPAESVDHD